MTGTTQTVFEDEKETPSVQEPKPVAPQPSDGELERVRKGKAHADEFIDFLKEQNEGLRGDLGKLLEEVNRLRAEAVVDKSRQVPTVSDRAASENTSQVSVDDIKNLVSQTISEHEKARGAAANIQLVDAKVKEKYGEKAVDWLKKKASELSLGVDFLQGIAATSPTAFFNLVGFDQNQVVPAPTVSSVNTEKFTMNTSGERDFKYYQELRKKDKKAYWDVNVQRQMFKDRQRLGEAFWNK